MISFVLDGGEAPEDSADHFVMILEGVIVILGWSVTSGSIVVVIVLLFVLELLSYAKTVLNLVLAVLVEGARAFEDFLVLFVVVTFGVRFVNSGDDVVWSAAAILTGSGSFWPMTATVLTVAAVVVASVVVALVTAASWAVSF